MKLRLDLDDVIFQLEIKGLAREPNDEDDEEDRELLWTIADFSLQGPYINYEQKDDEIFMVGEIQYLQHRLEALLKNEIEDDCTISFAEPDLEFNLSPAKRLYNIPGKVSYRNGYMDVPLYLEMKVSFWLKNGGLGSNEFSMQFDAKEIEALLVYLKTVTGELSGDDERVRALVQQGVLV